MSNTAGVTEPRQDQNIKLVSSRGRRSGGPRLPLIVASCVLGAVLLAFAGVMVYATVFYSDIYPNVSVDGLLVGGLDSATAERRIIGMSQNELSGKELPVSAGGEQLLFTPEETGAGIDAEATTVGALSVGRSGNIFERVGAIIATAVSGAEVESIFFIDRDYIASKVKAVSDKIRREKVDYASDIRDDKIIIQVGVEGKSFDDQALCDAIAERFKERDFSPLTAELRSDTPESLDVDALYDMVFVEPRNARLGTVEGESKIEPEVTGVSFDKTLCRDLLKNAQQSTIIVPLIYTHPEITAEKLGANLFKDVLSEKTTFLNAGLVNRTANVRLAASKVNETVIAPGEEFSYNNVVGPRTTDLGYKMAKVYVQGKIIDDVGGGICQVSSTIYLAALYADMEIVKRSNHQFTVGYVPLGQDATVSYGSVDFKFRNNTNYPIKILSLQEKNYMKVTILGTKENGNTVDVKSYQLSSTPYSVVTVENPSLEPNAKKVTTEGHTGFVYEAYRYVYNEAGTQIRKDYLGKSTYRKLDEQVEVGPGAAPPSPASPAPSDAPPPDATPVPPQTDVTPPVSPSPQTEEASPTPTPTPTPTPAQPSPGDSEQDPASLPNQ